MTPPPVGRTLPPSRPYRVLVVDDEPDILRMFKAALTNYGYVADEASDGREAIERIAGGRFDAVISDADMPGLGGLEFVCAVRRRDLHVPVILITSHPSTETSKKALESGAFRCLTRPVMPATLRDAIEDAARGQGCLQPKPETSERDGPTRSNDRAALEVRFAAAVQHLWFAFQPVVAWNSRRLYGYEALLRSTEPTLANPLAILATAELLGKVEELGRAVRARVAETPLPDVAKLFVKVHAYELNDEALYQADSPLAKTANRVVLEITQRASLHGVKDVERRVARLRELGFTIAVDDLGIGYAGLTSLELIRPEVAKLDRSLIRDVHMQPVKQSIVRSMHRLCEELGIAIVCEGVRTTHERDALCGLGCDLMQGRLFANPGPAFPVPCWT